MKFVSRYYFITALLLAALSGCTRDEIYDTGSHGDGVETSFSYAIPGMTAAVTRAAEADTEINSIDVLVYEVKSNGDEVLSYRQWATLESQQDFSGTFKVKLARSKAGEKYTMDFIFNARDVVNKALADKTIEVDKTRRGEVQRSLSIEGPYFKLSSGTCIPMWASLDTPTAIERNTVFNTQLNPIRSVARLKVGLNMDENDVAAGLPNFTLKSVYYTSYAASKGYIIPDKDKVSAGKATAPTLSDPYTQTAVNIEEPCSGGESGVLYLFELDANYTGSGGQKYGVIFKGDYTDHKGTAQYYYRLEFTDPTDPAKRIDFLRNHRYRINIIEVNGPGYTSLNAARTGEPSNVMYELSVNQTGDINHIVYSDKYYLGVSKLSLDYEGKVQSGIQDLKVLTNYPSGWQLTPVEEGTAITPGWINFTAKSGAANTKATATFGLSAYHYNDNPRVAIAGFSAGTLSLDVRITQYGRFFITTDYNGSMMQGEGDSWEVYVWGEVPPGGLIIRACSKRDGSDMDVCYERPVVAGGSYDEGDITRDLDIMGNAWLPMAVRQVEFQYSIDNGATWITFREGPQMKGHFRLKSTGRIVALYNMENDNGVSAYMTWAEAMGVDSDTEVTSMVGSGYNAAHGKGHNAHGFGYCYSHSTYPWKEGEKYKRVFHNYDDLLVRTNPGYALWTQAPGVPGTGYPIDGNLLAEAYLPGETGKDGKTGCAIYNEDKYGYADDYPKGRWRLPTIRELEEMADYEQHIGDLPLRGSNDHYWSSTEFADMTFRMQALYFHFIEGSGTGTGNIDNDNLPVSAKAKPKLVRCVFVPDGWVSPADNEEVAPEYFGN